MDIGNINNLIRIQKKKKHCTVQKKLQRRIEQNKYRTILYSYLRNNKEKHITEKQILTLNIYTNISFLLYVSSSSSSSSSSICNIVLSLLSK
jgi:hypothetical protein